MLLANPVLGDQLGDHIERVFHQQRGDKIRRHEAIGAPDLARDVLALDDVLRRGDLSWVVRRDIRIADDVVPEWKLNDIARGICKARDVRIICRNAGRAQR